MMMRAAAVAAARRMMLGCVLVSVLDMICFVGSGILQGAGTAGIITGDVVVLMVRVRTW